MKKKTKRRINGCIVLILLSGACVLWNHKSAKGSPSELGQKDTAFVMQHPDPIQPPEDKEEQKEEYTDSIEDVPNVTVPPQEPSLPQTDTPKEERPIADLPFSEEELIDRGFVKTEIGSLRNPYDPGNGYTILLVKDFWNEQDAENWMQEQISRTPEFANPFGDYRNYISENQDGSWSTYISRKGKE